MAGNTPQNNEVILKTHLISSHLRLLADGRNQGERIGMTKGGKGEGRVTERRERGGDRREG